MIRKFFLRLVAAFFVLLSAWPACAAFTDNGVDGSRTVSDSVTGLMWDKCSLGKTNDATCSGTATTLTWSAALDAVTTANTANLRGYSDWRLPNIKELESLVDLTRSSLTIDTTYFPNTASNYYWSSTTLKNSTYTGTAQGVSFNNGDVDSMLSKTASKYVRLVRGGRTFDTFDALGDSIPNAYTFTAQSDVALSSTLTSNSITVAGTDTVTKISISGGSYAINGGTYTSAAGAAYVGDTVTVQLTASASYGTATTATLTIGGVSGAFVATTLKGDQTLTFGSAPSVVVGGTGTVSAPSSASLTVSYTSTTSSICTVSGSTVTGVAVGTCTIAANQAGNSQYNAANQVTQTFSVGKGNPTVSAWPSAAAISYGQALSAATLSGGSSGVAGSFAYASPATTPSAGTASQSVTFTPTDTTNYNTVSGSVSVTVNMVTPTVGTWPTATAISYGQALSAATLSGGAPSVAGSFAFTTPATAPSAGTASHAVTFTPSDTTNYNSVTGTASVTVNKAIPAVSTWPTAAAISYGQALSAATLSGGSAGVAGSFAFTSAATAPSAGTASHSVTFTPTDTGNYDTLAGSVSVTVNKASQTISGFAATPATATVGGSATLSGAGGASANPLVYAGSTPTICTVSGATVSFVGAGMCELTATQAGNGNYLAATQTLSLSVANAATSSAPTTPSVVNADAGQETYVTGTTPVQAAAGSILNITSLSAAAGAVISLGDGTAPVTLKIGGKLLTVQSGAATAQVKLGSVSRNGVDVAVLIVTAGTVTVSAEAGQPLVAVGAAGVIVTAGEQGGAVKSAASGAGASTLSVTGGYVILPDDAFAAGTGFAALRDGKLYAGETVELDAAGQAGQARLGSHTGSEAALGDALVLAAHAGLSVEASVPNLQGRAARVSASQDYLDVLVGILGAGFASQGQDGDGVVRIGHGGGVLQLLPVGRLLVDSERADGITLTAPGKAEVVKNGVVASFAASLSDAAQFAGQLRRLDQQAVLTVKADGGLQAGFGNNTYLLQPDWNASRQGGAVAGLAVGEAGWLVFRDGAGHVQTLYPRIADLARLGEIARAADPKASIVANGDGTASAELLGKRYTLQADYALGGIPAGHAGQDWWMADDKLVIRNGDAGSQGYTVR